jgi:hypothetical protein
MGKTTPEENASTAGVAAAVQAIAGGAESAVIRAVPGQPWPEPPGGGRWVRNAKTGDLTCVEATQPEDQASRAARRAAQRAEDSAAAPNKFTPKD